MFKPAAYDVWKLNVERVDFIRNVLLDWQSAGIDVIIAPGFGIPAPLTGYPAWLQIASTYTCAYNLLDFPVGSMPVIVFFKYRWR